MDILRKLNGILAAIDDTARTEIAAIDSETSRRKTAALAAFEDELLVSVYNHIRRETSRIRSEAGTRVSAKTSECKRELYRVRSEAADELIGRVRERIRGFAESEQYPAALARIAARAARELAGDDLVVYLRECDLPLSDTLGIRAEFRAGEIELGGMIAESTTRRLRIDFTYDMALAKSRFRAASGSEI